MKNILKSKLFTTSSIYLLTEIINKAIPFLLLPILTRYLTTEEYGIFSMFTILIALVGPFMGFRTSGAVIRMYYDKEKLNFPQYVFNVFIILFMSIVIVSISIFFFSDLIYNFTAFPVEWLWALILISVGNFIIQILMGFWRIEYKPTKFGVFQILATIVNLSLTLYLIVILNYNWQGRVLGQVFAVSIFSCIAAYIIFKKGYFSDNKINKSYIKDAFAYGAPLIPHVIAASIISMSDRIFITNMIGVQATGIYAVGFQIGMIIGVIQTAFNDAWTPYFFEKLKLDRTQDKYNIVKITYVYYFIIILSALLLSSLAPTMIDLLLGEEFKNSYKYVFWIALGFAFNGMYKMVGNYIHFVKKTSYLSLMTFIAAILNIILNYVLINLNGAIGAAQATCLSMLISFLLTWVLSAKIYKMPWSLKKSI